MKWHESCRYMEHPREYSVEELAKFHGHLGPFVVLGYRIGRCALQYFDNNPFALFATVYCSGKPPKKSCLIDGIQIGYGCAHTGKSTSNCASRLTSLSYSGMRTVVQFFSSRVRIFPGWRSLTTLIRNSPLKTSPRLCTPYLPDEELFSVEEL